MKEPESNQTVAEKRVVLIDQTEYRVTNHFQGKQTLLEQMQIIAANAVRSVA